MNAAPTATLDVLPIPSTPATTQVPTLTDMVPANPGRKRVGIYLTPEAHRCLNEYCRLRDVSLTALLEGIAAEIADRIQTGDINNEYPLETRSLDRARQVTKQRRSRKPKGY